MTKENTNLSGETSRPTELHRRITARELREKVFVLLFLTGFYEKAEREEMAWTYLEDLPYTRDVLERIYDRYVLTASKIGTADPMIGKAAHGWNLRRIGKVELNLMRIAVFEIYFDPEIPMQVAINEAVELGRKYGGENSPAFVNGILSEVVKNNPTEEVTGAAAAAKDGEITPDGTAE